MTNQDPTIILCPGQGAQHVGMGKGWFDQYPVAAQTFAAADRALGYKLSTLCFEGPAEQLNRTDYAQVAIYVTSVACYQALLESNQIGPISATAGLSLGELTALHLAGAYDFVSGLQLVKLRGQAMQDAAQAQPSSMVALTGADETSANEVCQQARGQDILVPANYNSPGQVVISGSLSACQRAMEVAGKMGLRATALQVAGAFHSPLMQPAADRLAKALDQTQWQKPTGIVLSNVTGQPHNTTDIPAIKARLVEQLTSPVRWSGSMQWATVNLSGRYIELAPGKVLSGLMRRINRETKVDNFAEPSNS